MKRKYLVILILTITILFASFHIKQKKADAIAPWVAYVAVNVAVSLGVGLVMYLFDSNGNASHNIVTAVDAGTGGVSLDRLNDADGGDSPIWTATYWGGDVKYYPVVSHDYYTSRYTVASQQSQLKMNQATANQLADAFWPDFGTYRPGDSATDSIIVYLTDADPSSVNDQFGSNPDVFISNGYVPVPDGLGGSNTIDIGNGDFEVYDFIEDVPQLPDCFDGIQNQDETGIDCGGVCEFNFGFVCPPEETCFDGIQNQNETGVDCGGICEINYGFVCFTPETCFDGIMNQDETGIDFGGVCGTGDPVAPPAENFTDNNQDGVDDVSGLDSGGNIPVAVPGTADATTYDASLPGDVSEVGETDWTGLITGYLASNPLVLLATGSQINVTGAICSLPLTLFGKSMTIDFCSLDWMVDLFGSFVLGLMAIRAVFIAMGI